MRTPIYSLIVAATMSVASPAQAGEAQANHGARNVVLVHDQKDTSADWQKVFDVLIEDGYRVTLVDSSATSVASAVAATRRAISDQAGPVVLVGHASGGTVVTEAGTDPRVQSLVYMDAVVPEEHAETATIPAWKSKSSLYLIATKDESLAPAAQYEMAKRVSAVVVAVSSDRALFASAPVTTAKIIEQGAQLPRATQR